MPEMKSKRFEVTLGHRQRFRELVPSMEGIKDHAVDARMAELHEQLPDYGHLNRIPGAQLPDKLAALHHTAELISSLGELDGAVLSTYSSLLSPLLDPAHYIKNMIRVRNALERDSSDVVQKTKARTLAMDIAGSPERADFHDRLLDVVRFPASDLERITDSIDTGSFVKYLPENVPDSLNLLHNFVSLHYWGEPFEIDKNVKGILDRKGIGGNQKVDMLKGWVREMVAEETGMDVSKLKFDDVLATRILAKKGDYGVRAIPDKVKKIIEKYGSVHNYFTAKRPEYFTALFRDGLNEGAMKPGTGFKVPYSAKEIKMARDFNWQKVEPVTMDLNSALSTAISLLRGEAEQLKIAGNDGPWKGLAKVIRKVEGELPSDIAAYSYKDPKSLSNELLNWLSTTDIDKEEKREAALRLVEIRAFDETDEMRKKISASTGSKKASRIEEYWADLIKRHHLGGISRRFKEMVLIPAINARVKMLEGAKLSESGAGFEGEIEFRLSERDMKAFCKGYTSEDCTRDGSMLEAAGMGQALDPASFNFEMYERGIWIGNTNGVVVKDQKGKKAFLIDVVQPRAKHPLATADRRSSTEFSKRLYGELGKWAKSLGVDYMLLSADPSNRPDLRTGLKAAAGEKQESAVKILGTEGHFLDFGHDKTFIQALGGDTRREKGKKTFQRIEA